MNHVTRFKEVLSIYLHSRVVKYVVVDYYYSEINIKKTSSVV